MDWPELVTMLRSTFSAEQQRDGRVAVTVSYASGRSQLLVIDRFQAMDRDWISLRTRVCSQHRLDPHEALMRNRQLVVGDFCVEEGYLLLKENRLLSTLRNDEIELLVYALARTADELEASLETGGDRY